MCKCVINVYKLVNEALVKLVWDQFKLQNGTRPTQYLTAPGPVRNMDQIHCEVTVPLLLSCSTCSLIGEQELQHLRRLS